MARTVRDTKLETRAARSKLEVSGKPYYKAIGPGLHVGYRKNASGGKWVVRRAAGSQYKVETIGSADDIEDANGDTVLDFWQAQEIARGKRAYVGPYRVRDAVEHYLEHLAGEGKNSVGNAANRAERHIMPTLGEVLVADLTADAIRKWHRHLAQSMPMIPKTGGRLRKINTKDGDATRKRKVTANRVLTILRAALNLAFREGKTPSDAEWRRVEPFESVERARDRYLSFAECERLLNAADPDFRLLIRGALETGARYGELIRLRCVDYNADAGVVLIAQSKSGKPRHVILSEDGQAFFAQLTAGQSGSAPMFGKTWATSQQVRRMVKLCERINLVPHVGFHQLRHTWASHAVMQGMPLMLVAKNLGHADTRMVESHYGHLCPGYVADTVRKHAPRFGKVEGRVRAIR